MEQYKVVRRFRGFDVAGVGTVRGRGAYFPDRELRDIRGRTFWVRGRLLKSPVTDESGARVGGFRRDIWSHGGTIDWGHQHFTFRQQPLRSRYQLEFEGTPVVSLKSRIVDTSELAADPRLDPALVLFTLAVSQVLRSYQ